MTKGSNRRSTHKPRNPIASNPLLRKGGTHEKSRSSERQKQRQDIKKELQE